MGTRVLNQSHEPTLRDGNPACSRCGGLMVGDRYIDLQDDTGCIEFNALRCVQCGQVIDPVILQNRLCPVAVLTKKNRSKCAIRIV